MSGKGYTKGATFSKLLQIASSKRQSGTSSNFIFNVGTNLQQITRLSVNSVVFNNNFYNVYYNNSLDNNNTFLVTSNNGFQTVTITPGYYSLSQLLAAIATFWTTNGMTAIFGTFAYAYDSITNRVALTVTIVGTDPVVFTVSGNNNDSLLYYLGFDVFREDDVVAYIEFTNTTPTLVATHVPLLSGPSMVYIRSSTLAPSNAFDEKGRISNTLVSIPNTAPHNALTVMECKVDTLCEVLYGRPRELSLIDIQLTDRDGKILDLQGGSLNIELRVWYNNY